VGCRSYTIDTPLDTIEAITSILVQIEIPRGIIHSRIQGIQILIRIPIIIFPIKDAEDGRKRGKLGGLIGVHIVPAGRSDTGRSSLGGRRRGRGVFNGRFGRGLCTGLLRGSGCPTLTKSLLLGRGRRGRRGLSGISSVSGDCLRYLACGVFWARSRRNGFGLLGSGHLDIHWSTGESSHDGPGDLWALKVYVCPNIRPDIPCKIIHGRRVILIAGR
jgi:hypothetical protein